MRVVDGVNGVPPWQWQQGDVYWNITQALTSPPAPGTKVLVLPMSCNGVPLGYSEDGYPGRGNGEAFPLVIPAGVTLAGGGTQAAYIWTARPYNTEPLIRIQAAGLAEQTRKLDSLVLMGGPTAVHVDAPPGTSCSVTLTNIRFARNGTGLDVDARGTVDELKVKDCWITDDAADSGACSQPAYKLQSVGLDLAATEEQGAAAPGFLRATITNLQTTGGFSGLPWDSSLVKVEAHGIRNELLPGGGSQAIARAEVSFAGGVLDGIPGSAPAQSRGWHKGVVAVSAPATGQVGQD